MRVGAMLVAVVGLGLACGVAWAQEAKAKKPLTERQIITAQLRSADEAEKQAGLAAVRAMLAERPEEVVKGLLSWSPQMAEAGMHEEIYTLALRGMLEGPRETKRVIEMQKLRIRALAAQGKHEQALMEGRRLYNITWMKDTDRAIEIIAEAMTETRKDPQIARRLKQQQIAGAQQPAKETGDPGAAPSSPWGGDLGENIIKSIKVDPEPFEAAAEALDSGGSYANLMARGNLLLLADRAVEARAAFELACDAAGSEKDLAAAIESVARAMRGEDGTVARANAYIVSLRDGKSE